MPIFPFQCQSCGWVEEELVRHHAEIPSMPCPLKCVKPTWKKHHEILLSSAERLKADNTRFPHATHIRKPCVHMTRHGPQMGTERVIAKSRSHMEQLMEQHGYVYYDEYSDGGAQAKPPEMPKDLQMWGQHPSVLKYKDLVKQGRVPATMVLTEDELKDRFHV